MLNKRFKQLFEIQRARLTVDQSDGIDTKHTLQLSLRKQIIQHDFWHFVATQLHDNAHAVLIGLIAQFGNAFNLFVLDQLGDFLNQPRLVHHVRNFGENNADLAVFVIFFKMMTSP